MFEEMARMSNLFKYFLFIASALKVECDAIYLSQHKLTDTQKLSCLTILMLL